MLLVSCTAMRIWLGIGYEQPRVKLVGLDVVKANAKSVNLNVEAIIDNPNGFGIELKKIRYVILNQRTKKVADGELLQDLNLAAKSKKNIAIPVSLKPAQLGDSFVRFLLAPNQSQQFQVVATANFVTELGPIAVKTTRTEDVCLGKCE